MATESLVVELDARTEKLETRLKSTDAKIAALDNTTTKAGRSFGAFSKVGSGVSAGLGKTTAIAKKAALSFLAIKAAVTAAALASAKYAKEIKNNSELMRLSAEETQAWSSATQTVGIDMDKLGDISKDTSEKIGQFLTMGGGGFEDFGDAMGYTKEQALAAAREFKGLAGPDVLQSMVRQMEDAGVNADQMSFALEGMASDTTKLIPLLLDGGKAMKDLKDDFYETSVVLNETDISKLGELSSNFKSLNETFQGTMGKFSVEYADQINSMISTTQEGLKIVGDEFASGSFTDRLNSFYDAFTDSWAVAMGDNIDIFEDFTGDGQDLIQSLSAAFLEFALTLPINFAMAGNSIKEVFADIIDEVKIALAEFDIFLEQNSFIARASGDTLQQKQEILDAIIAEVGIRDEAHNTLIEQLQIEKDAIMSKFLAEQDAATAKREQYSADSAERMKILADEDVAERKLLKGKIGSNKKIKKSNADQTKAEEKGKADLTKNAMVLNQVLFDDNKLIGAGIIVAETAQNVVTSVKNSGGVPWGLPAGAAAAAMGIAQLSALKSSSKGGGSISSGNQSPPPIGQSNFEQETASLNISDSSDRGSQISRVPFATDSGDELMDVIARLFNEREIIGRG